MITVRDPVELQHGNPPRPRHGNRALHVIERPGRPGVPAVGTNRGDPPGIIGNSRPVSYANSGWRPPGKRNPIDANSGSALGWMALPG